MDLLKLTTLMSSGKKKDMQETPLVMTVTTTGAQTLTLQGMTVADGKAVVVDWGDGNTSTYTAGAGARTHAYSGAGVWTVKLANRGSITELDLRDTKITSLVIDSANPLPSGLTYLRLESMSGLTYNVNASPLPAGLTTLHLQSLSGLTYDVNANPLPAGLTYLYLYNLPGFNYNVNANPLPAGLTYLYIYYMPGVTYNVNANPLPAGLTSLYLGNLSGVTYDVDANPLPAGLTSLYLEGFGLTYDVNSNPLPAGLTYLRLISLAGLTYDVNANPLPAGLTYLCLINLSGVTWIINAAQPWPTGATTATVLGCPNITCTTWTDNAIWSIVAENAYSQANVDAFLSAILANKANFTYATPTLDLLGGGNAAPSGTYQAADPVTSGNEAAYALVNGNGSYAAGPEWVVQTA